MSSLRDSAAGGEAGTRRAHTRADSSAFTSRQENTTPPQNARCPATCAAACAARPTPLPAKGLRRLAARARPGPGHSPSGCCFPGNTGKFLQRSAQPRCQGRPFPRGRRCLPAPARPYLRERPGRRPAAAPAAPACRSRGPAGLPQHRRRWGRGAALGSGRECHRPGPSSPPAVPGRPPPSFPSLPFPPSRPHSAAPAPAPPRPRSPGRGRGTGSACHSPECASGAWVTADGSQSPSVSMACLSQGEAALKYPQIFLSSGWSISIPQSVCMLSINTSHCFREETCYR